MIRKLLQSLQRIETMYDLKSITEEQYAMMELMQGLCDGSDRMRTGGI